MSGQSIEEVFVDRGYRGHDVSDSAVYISGQRFGVSTRRLKQSLKRRQVIEPIIGHLKNEGLLGWNCPKGQLGDQMNVTLSCVGHNLRLVSKCLEYFCVESWGRFWLWMACWDGLSHRNGQLYVTRLRSIDQPMASPPLLLIPNSA